jgi:nucleoside-diphosphate-sugar epimerase
MRRVLVTGATGFVGQPLCELLAHSGLVVRAALRNDRAVSASIAEKAVVGDIAATTDWRRALDGVDAVLHIAARVHLNNAGAGAQLYNDTNTRATEHLAQASARAGIRRFVFLSSVKVNGEETTDQPYSAHDEPQPQGAYGTSKWLAEKRIAEIARATGMEAVIVRSPLVYGPGVRANFLRLLRWVDKEWPLPLGAVKNRRSLVSIWNLCDLLMLLLEHPLAPGRTWMVSDGNDISTPGLIHRLGSAMNRRVRLLPVPMGLLHLFGKLAGREAEVARLCGSLLVNIDHTRRELKWVPPVELNEGLARTVAAYLASRR